MSEVIDSIPEFQKEPSDKSEEGEVKMMLNTPSEV